MMKKDFLPKTKTVLQCDDCDKIIDTSNYRMTPDDIIVYREETFEQINEKTEVIINGISFYAGTCNKCMKEYDTEHLNNIHTF